MFKCNLKASTNRKASVSYGKTKVSEINVDTKSGYAESALFLISSFLDDSFRKNLESALRFGNPLLVQVSYLW